MTYKQKLTLLYEYYLSRSAVMDDEYNRLLEYFIRRHYPMDAYDIHQLLEAKIRQQAWSELLEHIGWILAS